MVIWSLLSGSTTLQAGEEQEEEEEEEGVPLEGFEGDKENHERRVEQGSRWMQRKQGQALRSEGGRSEGGGGDAAGECEETAVLGE